MPILLLPTINSQNVLAEPAKYDIPEYNSQIQIVPGDGFRTLMALLSRIMFGSLVRAKGIAWIAWIIQMAG